MAEPSPAVGVLNVLGALLHRNGHLPVKSRHEKIMRVLSQPLRLICDSQVIEDALVCTSSP
jgi:hypothetical protein